jgi:hypothetical protein
MFFERENFIGQDDAEDWKAEPGKKSEKTDSNSRQELFDSIKASGHELSPFAISAIEYVFDQFPEQFQQVENLFREINRIPSFLGEYIEDLVIAMRAYIIESKPLKEKFAEILEQYHPITTESFLWKVSSVGKQTAETFFKEHEKEWKNDPSLALKKFELDASSIRLLAEQKIMREGIAIPSDGKVEVQIDVPSIQYNPYWFDAMLDEPVSSYPTQDDTDFRVPYELSQFIEPKRPFSRAGLLQIMQALREGNEKEFEKTVEQTVRLGPVPPEKLVIIRSLLEQVDKTWSDREENEEKADADMTRYRKERENLRISAPLPDSAKPFSVEHQRHGKFTYPSFEEQLKSKMLEPLMVAVVDQARNGTNDPRKLFDFLSKLELQVRTLYRDVVKRGVPLFKDFVDWVEGEFQKAKSGYAGEFYVGRDMYTTLYAATRACRWAKLPQKDIHRLTAYVNVSRPLFAAMGETLETRAMMKTWLEQAGITRQMFGIDGGYVGNSPLGVFHMLSQDITEDYSKRVKLVQSHDYPERLFNPSKSYAGLVEWMETLPKFTERSQKLTAGKHGKYFVNALHRTAVERTLAWTVQRAVWREFVTYQANSSSLETTVNMPTLPVESDPLEQNSYGDDDGSFREALELLRSSKMTKFPGFSADDDKAYDDWEPGDKHMREGKSKKFVSHGRFICFDQMLGGKSYFIEFGYGGVYYYLPEYVTEKDVTEIMSQLQLVMSQEKSFEDAKSAARKYLASAYPPNKKEQS